MSICIEHNNFETNHNNFSQNVSAHKKAVQFPITVFSKWNVFKQVKVWNSRSRQRRDLAVLDERMLSDIGYTPAQAREEFTKPFWK